MIKWTPTQPYNNLYKHYNGMITVSYEKSNQLSTIINIYVKIIYKWQEQNLD